MVDILIVIFRIVSALNCWLFYECMRSVGIRSHLGRYNQMKLYKYNIYYFILILFLLVLKRDDVNLHFFIFFSMVRTLQGLSSAWGGEACRTPTRLTHHGGPFQNQKVDFGNS